MARSVAATKASSEPLPSALAARRNEDIASMASYIADMASELAQLASGGELQMVAYFLNLARVEAEIRARELGGYAIERDVTSHSGA